MHVEYSCCSCIHLCSSVHTLVQEVKYACLDTACLKVMSAPFLWHGLSRRMWKVDYALREDFKDMGWKWFGKSDSLSPQKPSCSLSCTAPCPDLYGPMKHKVASVRDLLWV